MQEMWVQSLVGELRSCMPRGMAKNLKKKKKRERKQSIEYNGCLVSEIIMPIYKSNKYLKNLIDNTQ